MTISYPITTPTSIGIGEVTLTAANVTASSTSPFTFKEQVFQWPGQRWEAKVMIPPCKKDLAEDWVAFLVSLKGRVGTFQLGDPNNTVTRGEATTLGDTVRVNGGGQTGGTLAVDGMTPNTTNYFKAGDYIQIFTGSDAQLYKVLTNTDSDGLGEATLDIWPDLRGSPTNDNLVITEDTYGVFRLKSPNTSWSINDISSYGIEFEAVEAFIIQ